MTISSSGASGSYILVLYLQKAATIEPGSLGKHIFSAGYYGYVGSAMSGLKPRLRRHLTKDKTPRWHIDYLTKHAVINSIVIIESALKLECSIAKALESQFTPIAGFGCSDCECNSHLFFAPREEDMTDGINSAVVLVGCPHKVLERKDIPRYLRLKRG